ncbi:MAG: tetratricopeptide repeat protein [Bdellovibrionales bacterium]
MSEFDNWIEYCEAAMREGKSHLVAQKMEGLDFSKIPRAARLPMANLGRRAGLFQSALKILRPAIFLNKNEFSQDAHERELAEYAVILERCGAVSEALQLLNRVSNPKQAPEAMLYKAFCLFKTWRYGEAIGDLKRYLQLVRDPYSHFVGHVNLAAALVAEFQYQEAHELLSELISQAQASGYGRLRGNCFELRSQTHMLQGRFHQAEFDLSSAYQIFRHDRTLDQFFVEKWRAVLIALRSSDLDPLQAIQAKARRRRDWESVREGDLFACKVNAEEPRLARLYFGTPFSAYRNRIHRMLEKRPESESYIHGIGKSPCLDLATGEIEGGVPIKPGKSLHQVLGLFMRDLYRPIRIGEIFSSLFPNEHFNPYSSPGRVHQTLFRLRQWLSENDLPVVISHSGREYSATITGPFAVRLSSDQSDFSGWSPHWVRLEKCLADKSHFTSADVRELLDMKHSTCKRFLKWAVESGKAVRLGSNNTSQYERAQSSAGTTKAA